VPGTFVTDDVLTRCISELRRVFEDNPKKSRFIQTIPKRGYRLIAPVGFNRAIATVAVPSVGREVSAVVGNITAMACKDGESLLPFSSLGR
jgi:DNA-binding winged helix-turn-helix (wHTH) protein